MLTSVDIVGHLASGVWSLDRFICFSFADLILIQFERSRGECVPRAALVFSHGKYTCLNFTFIALGVDQCPVQRWLCMFDCHWACRAKRGCNKSSVKGTNPP